MQFGEEESLEIPLLESAGDMATASPTPEEEAVLLAGTQVME